MFCILCNGIVSYSRGDTKRFDDHMNIEHGAFYNLDYILAGCLMSGDQRKVVSELIEENPAVGNPDRYQVSDAENLKDVSILDKAFPLVEKPSPSTNPSASVSLVEVSKVKCGLCDSRLLKKSLNKHLKKVHKLGKEDRDIVLKSTSNIGIENKSEELVNGECGKEDLNDGPIADEMNEAAEVEVENDSNIHIDDQKFKCPFCDSLFTKSQNLKRHVLKQHPEDEDMKCNFCEYTCKEQKSLKCHVAAKHKGEVLVLTTNPPSTSTVEIQDKYLKCELCKYTCTKASSLKIHKTMKHKVKENFEQKLLVSQSLFKRKSSKSEDEGLGKECNKCSFIANTDKELRRHRFQNHRHELMKKEGKVKVETLDNGENLLIEGSAVSLDLNDMSIEIDEHELDNNQDLSASSGTSKNMLSKEEYYIFNKKKTEVLEKSEYFSKFPKNLLAWTGPEEDLVPGESLPAGFGVKHSVTSKGKKYVGYVTPNRHFKLRSLKAVLEYMKINQEFTEEEVRSLEVKLKVKTL